MYQSTTADSVGTRENGDPEPYLWQSGGRSAEPSRWGGSRDGRYMPRPEFDRPAVNPILLWVRAESEFEGWLHRCIRMVGLADSGLTFPMATPAEIAHAHRVLTLLVAVSE